MFQGSGDPELEGIKRPLAAVSPVLGLTGKGVVPSPISSACAGILWKAKVRPVSGNL